MRGSLETIVGAMFAGKTSELLKRILWAKHQNKKIIVIKPNIDNRYSQGKIITHNDLSQILPIELSFPLSSVFDSIHQKQPNLLWVFLEENFQ